jgi:hypothetical protein
VFYEATRFVFVWHEIVPKFLIEENYFPYITYSLYILPYVNIIPKLHETVKKFLIDKNYFPYITYSLYILPYVNIILKLNVEVNMNLRVVRTKHSKLIFDHYFAF